MKTLSSGSHRMRRVFLSLFVFFFVMRDSSAAVDQSTLLGQIELATRERGAVAAGTSAYDSHIENYRKSNGGPRLATFGITLGTIIRNPAYALAMSVVMALLVGASIVTAMRNPNRALPDLLVNLVFKFIIGIAVFHFPSFVYASGMIIRDFGMSLAQIAFQNPTSGPPLQKASAAISPQGLDFDRIRVVAMDQSIQDHGQPMKGAGSHIAGLLYDQMVARVESVPKGKAQAAAGRMPRVNIHTEALGKSRVFDENISKLLQMLSAVDSSRTFTFTAYRAGPGGMPDTTSRIISGGVDNQSLNGIAALRGQINGSEIKITTASLSEWLKTAESVRTTFMDKASKGGFPSPDAYKTELDAATERYGNEVYVRTSAFLKKTYWDNLGFACGALGSTKWDYLNNFSDEQIQQISASQKDLNLWFGNTTGRPAASFSVSAPSEQRGKENAARVLEVMAFARDQVISRLGVRFFDIVVEFYTFILWITFPLWFHESTAKAFTGAFNVFIMACLTPATFTLIFVIWDAFIGYMISVTT